MIDCSALEMWYAGTRRSTSRAVLVESWVLQQCSNQSIVRSPILFFFKVLLAAMAVRRHSAAGPVGRG